MRRFVVGVIVTILVMCVFSAGCIEHKNYREEYREGIKENGSGNFITETRNATGLNNLGFSDDFYYTNMTIDQGDKDSVTIEAEDNVMPYIKTEYVANGFPEPFFEIGYNKGMPKPTKPIKIHITTKNLNDFRFKGEGNVTLNNINTSYLRIGIDFASCRLNNVQSDNLNVSLNGRANMTVDGRTDLQTVDTYGKCNYQADGLESRIATVFVENEGKVTVNVKELLNAKIEGFGEIFYLGNPQLNQSTLLGRISRID